MPDANGKNIHQIEKICTTDHIDGPKLTFAFITLKPTAVKQPPASDYHHLVRLGPAEPSLSAGDQLLQQQPAERQVQIKFVKSR